MSDRDEAKEFGELTATVRIHDNQIRRIFDLQASWHNEIRTGMEKFDNRLDALTDLVVHLQRELRSGEHNRQIEAAAVQQMFDKLQKDTDAKIAAAPCGADQPRKAERGDVLKLYGLILTILGVFVSAALGFADEFLAAVAKSR